MSTIKKWAILEPLVDHADSRAINSNTSKILVKINNKILFFSLLLAKN